MIIENTTLYNIVDSDVKEGELIIPDGITDVNLELFATQHQIRRVIIPKSVETLGFYGNVNPISSITIQTATGDTVYETISTKDNFPVVIDSTRPYSTEIKFFTGRVLVGIVDKERALKQELQIVKKQSLSGIGTNMLEAVDDLHKKEDAERLKKRRNKNLYDKRKNPKEPEL
ncbi:MAG: hypothetical protein RSD35_07960 [Oscillospiraceae bacterium]